jgi:hypothetical protein
MEAESSYESWDAPRSLTRHYCMWMVAPPNLPTNVTELTLCSEAPVLDSIHFHYSNSTRFQISERLHWEQERLGLGY